MGYAAERVGLELEDMIDVTEEMRIKAFDAAEGSEAMAAHFAELGINVQEFLALDADEQFNLDCGSPWQRGRRDAAHDIGRRTSV